MASRSVLVGLQHLLDEATPRDWMHASDGTRHEIWGAAGTGADGLRKTLARATTKRDAALIVAAVNHLPHLLAVVKAARVIEALQDAGGTDWWEAHAKLYLAVARLDGET